MKQWAVVNRNYRSRETRSEIDMEGTTAHTTRLIQKGAGEKYKNAQPEPRGKVEMT